MAIINKYKLAGLQDQSCTIQSIKFEVFVDNVSIYVDVANALGTMLNSPIAGLSGTISNPSLDDEVIFGVIRYEWTITSSCGITKQPVEFNAPSSCGGASSSLSAGCGLTGNGKSSSPLAIDPNVFDTIPTLTGTATPFNPNANYSEVLLTLEGCKIKGKANIPAQTVPAVSSCWERLKSNGTALLNEAVTVSQRTLQFNYFPSVPLHVNTGLVTQNVFRDPTIPRYTFTNNESCPVLITLNFGASVSLRTDIGGGVTQPIQANKKYLLAWNFNTGGGVNSTGLISSTGGVVGRSRTWFFENQFPATVPGGNNHIGMTWDDHTFANYSCVLAAGGTLDIPIQWFFNAFYEDNQVIPGVSYTIRTFCTINETVTKF